MTILLTGATGYIGQRLLPEAGHEPVCLVRDARRFALPGSLPAALRPQGLLGPAVLVPGAAVSRHHFQGDGRESD